MSKNNKQNNSMFIYTALIFVLALIFIILAFFGQTNLSNLRRETEDISSADPVQTESAAEAVSTAQPTPASNEELAIMANTLSGLRVENENLKGKINVYDSLLAANGYISVGSIDEAENILNTINRNSLNDDQKILFDQIINIINEGKEQ